MNDRTAVHAKHKEIVEKQLKNLEDKDTPNSGLTLAFPAERLEEVKKALPGMGEKGGKIELQHLLAYLRGHMNGTSFYSHGNPVMTRLTTEMKARTQARKIIEKIKKQAAKKGMAAATGEGCPRRVVLGRKKKLTVMRKEGGHSHERQHHHNRRRTGGWYRRRSRQPAHPPDAPDYVMAKVQLLLNQETAPETNVTFDTQSQSRADPNTIKDTINPGAPYQLAWTWDKDYAREHQQVANGDVGKFGYQVDIDSYFRLDNLNDPAHPQWTLQPNPDATSNPLELATGASDAVAYHDFYRLQIAFEDVWAELIDKSIGTTAQEFYAKWDALMNASMGSDTGAAARIAAFNAIPTGPIGGYEELETFLNNVRLILDLPTVTPPSGSAGFGLQ